MNPFTNPFIMDILTGWLRHALVGIPGVVVAPSDAEKYAVAIVTLLAGALSTYQKYTMRQKLETAKASVGKLSEEQLNQKIASGLTAPVMTAAQDVPVISASR